MMLSALENNKQWRCHGGDWISILCRIVRERLTKMTKILVRLSLRWVISYSHIWQKRILGRGKNKAKTLRWRNTMRPVWSVFILTPFILHWMQQVGQGILWSSQNYLPQSNENPQMHCCKLNPGQWRPQQMTQNNTIEFKKKAYPNRYHITAS